MLYSGMDITEQWVLDTLRNTPLKQTTRTYYDDSIDCYCAVGALLATAHGGTPRGWLTGTTADRVYSVVPVSDIMHWNDEEGLTFAEIADRLEELWN